MARNPLNRLILRVEMAAVDRALFLIQEIAKNAQQIEDILAIIGLIYVGRTSLSLGLKLLEGFRVYFLARFSKKNLRQYGEWAVITGATDGIGKAYARELAKHGLNIILISRNLERLQATAQEIEQDFKVQTWIIQADFLRGREIYPEIREKLKGKEIGILVNNVGSMYDAPSYFHRISEEKIWQLVNLNIAGVMMMTHTILPQMVERKKGVIVNMSSISGFLPLPLMAGYSASKVFVDWFSRALMYEYKNQGIIIQSLVPSYISTNLVRFSSFLSRPSYMVPDPKTFSKSAIATIGVTNRTTGYWTHGLQYAFYEICPEWLWSISSWILLKSLDDSKKQNQASKRD